MIRIRFYLKKYLSAGLLTIGVVFFLLLFSTQIQPLLNNFEREKQLSARISSLSGEIRTIRAASGSQAASQLAIVTAALPDGKDATRIYSLITTIASKHAIDIESFSIDVGEVLIGSKEEDGSYSSLSVSLDVISPAHVNTQQFINELYHSIPISAVESMRVVEGQGQIVLNFFYSQPSDGSRATQISPSQQALLSELSGWTQP